MLHAMRACMNNNISSVLAGQDDLDRALTKYHKALEIQEHEALTSLTVTTCYNNIGSVLLDLGSIERVSQGFGNSRAGAEDAKAAARQRIGFTRELEQPRTVLNMVSPVQRGNSWL